MSRGLHDKIHIGFALLQFRQEDRCSSQNRWLQNCPKRLQVAPEYQGAAEEQKYPRLLERLNEQPCF